MRGFTTKLTRADEHREKLTSEVNGWIDSDPITPRNDIDEEAGQIVAYVEFDPLPDYDRWAVIIGDVIHNLRSALDHLAWQLVLLNDEEPDHRTCFPIYRISDSWRDNSGPCVRGMSDVVVARIEGLQPYHRGDDAEKTLLWILHEMNRQDKHRLLTPVVLRSETFKWEVEPEPAQVTFTPTMKHRTPFMFIRPSQGLANVHVKVETSAHVAIDFGSGRRIEVAKLLADIRNEVANVGKIFGGFFE